MTTHDQIPNLKQRISTAVIGQEAVVEQLRIALLADGYVLCKGCRASPRRERSRRWQRISKWTSGSMLNGLKQASAD
jgi:hypothetical protein